jgi:hypothetical protein
MEGGFDLFWQKYNEGITIHGVLLGAGDCLEVLKVNRN